MRVSDGTGATIARIPAGAQVTLSEADATVAGVWFSDPSYSGTGVQLTGPRTATVTGNSGTVNVGLENPTSLVPVATPTATPTQVPSQVPNAQPIAVPPLVPPLATTSTPTGPTPGNPGVTRTPVAPDTTTPQPGSPRTPASAVTTTPTPTTSEPSTPPPTTASRTSLAHTGANVLPALLGMTGLLAAGAGLVIADRRRRVRVKG